jgi:hypothetical protein
MRAIRLPLSSAAPTSSISWVNGVAGMLTVANRKGRGIDDHRWAGSELKDETPPNTPGFQ